jgi:enamine deaminase RidA (YjgF/YER057c/UK114 family)
MITMEKEESVEYSLIELSGGVTRLALMVAPESRGDLGDQLDEAVRAIHTVVGGQSFAAELTVLTVFLRDPATENACREMFSERFGAEMPLITYVHQPPCDGAALAIEAWAIGGGQVRIRRPAPGIVATTYNGLKWVQCGDIVPRVSGGVYAQALDGFKQMRALVERGGLPFDRVLRTWLYLGDIVGPEGDTQRYKELNRARTDFYRDVRFGQKLLMPGVKHSIYPASTGIGMSDKALVMSCLALDSDREDVFIRPLENPQQTPAYEYAAAYSPKSPKFSRAMALMLGEHVITWVSGTASIVDSESKHIGDPAAQTEQTIDNIERLISRENFERHGLGNARATAADLAKVRVYVKRPEDYRKCREVCERRFPNVPAVYTVADVCRPELLVEIEGLAFSRREAQ